MPDSNAKPIGFIIFLMIAAAVFGFAKWVLFSEQKDRILADELQRLEEPEPATGQGEASPSQSDASIIRELKNLVRVNFSIEREYQSTATVTVIRADPTAGQRSVQEIDSEDDLSGEVQILDYNSLIKAVAERTGEEVSSANIQVRREPLSYDEFEEKMLQWDEEARQRQKDKVDIIRQEIKAKAERAILQTTTPAQSDSK